MSLSLNMAASNQPMGQDQNKVLRARKNAKILPYGKVAKIIEQKYQGRIVNQKLVERKDGQWVYELRVLNQDNKVINVILDAVTGKEIKPKKR